MRLRKAAGRYRYCNSGGWSLRNRMLHPHISKRSTRVEVVLFCWSLRASVTRVVCF